MNTKFPHVTPSIAVELRKRVNQYFIDKNIKPTGNFSLYLKALTLLTAFITLYIFLVFIIQSVAVGVLLCIVLGTVCASIGFNIMHDGSHGSFSSRKTINRCAAYTLDLLGGSSFMWNVKHNILHHTYTNIEGLDDDIDIKPFMRMSTDQKRYWFHKYQFLYFWVLYSFLYLFWVFFSDFKKIFSKKIGLVNLKKMSFKDYAYFFTTKVVYLILFIGLPIWHWGIVKFILGYLIFAGTAGVILSIVFQLAHTVLHAQFPQPNPETGLMEDEFALHQIKTTSNFATKSKILSWYVGGLNFQVEHHLFPKISHIHYPAINKIVKEVCAEWNIKYLEYKTFMGAFYGHLKFLYQAGRMPQIQAT